MKTVVYIDGQNFLYKAADVLIKAKKITEKQDLHTFSFRTLIEGLLGEKDIEIRFYGTRLRRYKNPPEIADKSKIMVDSQRRLRNCLSAQEIEFIESGKLKLRDGDVCKKCGKQDARFQEKGVDVKIAVDMSIDACDNKAQRLVLISSDTDLLPAIQNVLARGKEVIYVGFSDKLTKAIVVIATETQIIRDAEIVDAYNRTELAKLDI
jgi:uncharacterized LabA/DUF88 family protein